MKCTGISVGTRHPQDKRTLEQFVGSEQAKSPLGKLLIALVEEKVWSDSYEVNASLGERPCLCITHKVFSSSRQSLIVRDDGAISLSVRGVEDAIRTHLRHSWEAIEPSIEILENKISSLHQTSRKIAIDKAKAAIVAVFPEAVDASWSGDELQGDLYCFLLPRDINGRPIFVAREIDHEFIGGVARIDCSYSHWYGAARGIEAAGKYGIFWVALAQAFVAREVGIPEEELRYREVHASEVAPPPFGNYKVDKVVLSAISCLRGVDEDIVVEFGVDNLPNATIMLPAREAAANP